MEIRRDNNRVTHGVTQLTYVGDYETSASPSSSYLPSPALVGLVGVGAVLLGSGLVRLGGIGAILYALRNR